MAGSSSWISQTYIRRVAPQPRAGIFIVKSKSIIPGYSAGLQPRSRIHSTNYDELYYSHTVPSRRRQTTVTWGLYFSNF